MAMILNRTDCEKILSNDETLIDFSITKYSEKVCGFLSDHYKLTLTSNNRRHGGIRTQSYFLKTVPEKMPCHNEYIENMEVFRKEILMYNGILIEFLPLVSKPFAPAYYHSVTDKCLILEDMRLQGYQDKKSDQSELVSSCELSCRRILEMVPQKANINGGYELVPPDGGWGYLITVSVIVVHIVTIVPLAAFGLLYGEFLASIGDETAGTTLSNGAFNTVQSFTGLATSFLLRRFSYRKVGLVGALVFSVGAFGTVFVNNLTQLIITLGILEGIGFGLMFPAVMSAMNSYFEKRLNLMMGLAQTFITIGSILSPLFIGSLMESIGFRNTLVVLALLTLLNIPATGVLQPAKWHMKRVPIEVRELPVDETPSKITAAGHVLDCPIEPLLQGRTNERKLETTNEEVKILDLRLLKDPKYLNMSIGLSLCFTADLAFTSIIRMVLNNLHFNSTDITLMTMVYFSSDLVSRMSFSVLSYFFTVRNRYVFLMGATLSAVFRVAFVFRDDYTWKMINLIILGFLRCFIQTPLSLVISDEYKDNFSTALSLFMVVSGIVSLLFGPLLSYVKAITQSDVMVIHVLTIAYAICSISWTVELIYRKVTGKRSRKEQEK